jgi:hypothetical protein
MCKVAVQCGDDPLLLEDISQYSISNDVDTDSEASVEEMDRDCDNLEDSDYLRANEDDQFSSFSDDEDKM